MSILFTPHKIGDLEIENRFVHSATFENMASEKGEVTPALERRYRNLAKGGVGLIIPGFFYVHEKGRGFTTQAGIHRDSLIPGLKALVDAVHDNGMKIVFQICHTGRQTSPKVIGTMPVSPSKGKRDPVYRVAPREIKEEEILEVINAFIGAVKRAHEAGADGIQLHGCHGYLISQFLSPYFNRRKDKWGGSDENRFRFLREIIVGIKKAVPKSMPLLVKMNADDHTPKPGIRPELARKYAKWMVSNGVQGIEVSCGTSAFSLFNEILGDVPVKEILQAIPWPFKIPARWNLQKLRKRYSFQENFNLDYTKYIKPEIGNASMLAVGGIRTVADMENIIQNGHADFISLCRPFIREPYLVNKIKEKKIEKASCLNCNKCTGGLINDLPVKCYSKGLPRKKK